MADIKISELGAASAVNSTDIFPMNSAGVTVKATAQQIKNYMGVGDLSDLNTTDKTSAVAAINEVKRTTESAIATLQNTLTASKNYAVGEQFIYQGLLYKVTQTIASGGTITIGNNCTLADSVTKQIKLLDDNTPKIINRVNLGANEAVNIGFSGEGRGSYIISVSSSVSAYGTFITHTNDSSKLIDIYALTTTTPGVQMAINSGNPMLLIFTNTSSQPITAIITKLS